MNKKHIDWIDIAKGIGMIFVIWAHALPHNSIRQYIYSFHMPLFFFISGYLFSLSRTTSFTLFFKKRVKTLLVPYLGLSMIAYAYWALIQKFIVHAPMSVYYLKPLVGTFMGIRDSIWTVHNSALWFVLCLFLAEIIFFVISRSVKNNLHLILWLLLLACVGYLYNYHFKTGMPWSLDLLPYAIIFYGSGYLVAIKKHFFEKISPFLLLPILLIANGVLAFLNSPIDLFYDQFGNFLLFYFAAFSGIGAWLLVAKIIKTNFVFSYIGKNSLTYMAFHLQCFPIIKMAFSFLIFKKLSNSPIFVSVFITVSAILILIPAIELIIHYLPWAAGRKMPKADFKNKLQLKYE